MKKLIKNLLGLKERGNPQLSLEKLSLKWELFSQDISSQWLEPLGILWAAEFKKTPQDSIGSWLERISNELKIK